MNAHDPTRPSAASGPKSRRTFYDVLKIAPDAPPEVVHAAYRSLARLFHPDLNSGHPDKGRAMQELNAAYAVLSDPSKRASYDFLLKRVTPPAVTALQPRPTTNLNPEVTPPAQREVSAPKSQSSTPPTRGRSGSFQDRERRRRMAILVLRVALPVGFFALADHLIETGHGFVWVIGNGMMMLGIFAALHLISFVIRGIYY